MMGPFKLSMYYITISNGLLEGDHHEKMGAAVWLYMWLIDKVTRIDEDGIGWVLGGKPIQIAEVKHMTRRSVQRYIATLRNEDYIIVKRTMRGMILGVKKAKKSFGRGTPKLAHLDTPLMAHDGQKVAHHDTKSGASNKTVAVDSTVDRESAGKPATPASIARTFFEKGDAYEKCVEALSKTASRQAVEDELGRFIEYWTEPNKSGTKVRWEQEKTFEIGRRLKKWLSNVRNYQNKNKQRETI